MPAMSDATQTAELELAVHLVLSRLLGTQSGRRAYNAPVCVLATAIAGCNRMQGPAVDGALKRRGLKPTDLDNLWVVARSNGQLLERDLVDAFFPATVWEAVANLISLGPVRAWERSEQLLSCWARGLETDGTKRHRMSKNTMELHLGAFHRLARELCELRKLADAGTIPLARSVLEDWRPEQIPAKLKAEQLGAAPSNNDRRAPSLRGARRALKAAHRDVEQRKRHSAMRRTLVRPLRNRALLAVFLVTGARLRAIAELTRADFVRHYRSGDHVGPALLLRPGKTIQRDVVRVKVLPDIVGDWIQEWINYVGIDDEPEASLWPVSRDRRTSVDPQSVTLLIRKMLAPFVPGQSCSPHTLRHLCEKLAFQAGMDWLEANRKRLLEDESLSGMPTSPQTFADALLDHSLSTVQDTYKDISSERGREVWARIAAAGVWEYVWGERGAPKGPDVGRINAAREALDTAANRRANAEQMLARLKTQKALLRQRAGTDDSLDAKALIQMQFQTDDVADQIIEAAVALSEAEHALELTQAELAEAQSALVPVDDDVDVAALEREVADGVPAVAEVAPPPAPDQVGLFEGRIRDRVNPREFHWALGSEQLVSDVTLRRYIRGQLPYPAGDRRNLWDAPSLPGQLPGCIERPSPRKTWILVDHLDLTRYTSGVIKRLAYLQTLREDEVFELEEQAA
jgi:integrase